MFHSASLPVSFSVSEFNPIVCFRFYFPNGKPCTKVESEPVLQKVEALFETFPDKRAKLSEMGRVAEVCDLPRYLKRHLFIACDGRTKGAVTFQDFAKLWDE